MRRGADHGADVGVTETGVLGRAGAELMLERVARPRSERPVPPRLPAELPLEQASTLGPGDQISGLTLRGDYATGHLDGLVVEESHVVRSSFTAADLSGLTLVDVLVEGSDFSGADMQEATFTRVVFKNCRMSGARIPRTRMQDVTFSEVRLDDANFRMSTGERVVFDHSNLARGDFYAARLMGTRFFDCDLTGADVTKATLPGTRFQGSILLELKGGEYLRNVVIDSSQVLPLALGVFAGLNIRVEDERETPHP
jgi:Pentapeptide repeats (9 copies)